MTLLELMRRANAGFSDGFLESYFDPATGQPKPRTVQGRGDTLAETFDPYASDADQIQEAERALMLAQRELKETINSIYRGGEK